jgi:large subunit ribosomal protein L21
MYAVIETGGKQYRVELGTELAVERLDADPGSTINLERVLLVADGDNAQIGTPTVAEAVVTADVVRQDRGEKIIVFKYRPKARHRSKKGHRQELTVLRVADIRFNGRSAADEAGAQKQDKKAEQAKAEAAAQKKATADQELAAKLAADAEAAAAAKADAATDAKPAAKTTTRKPAAATKTASKAEAAPKATAKTAKPAAKTTKPAAKTTAAKTSATETKASAEKTTAKPAAKKSAAAKSEAETEKD